MTAHLDDHRLSAVLDGLEPPEDRDHLAACSECAGRLARWREVGEHLAGLGGGLPDAPGREMAVLAALAAADDNWSGEDWSGRENADTARPAYVRSARMRQLQWVVAAGVTAVLGIGVAAGLTGGHTHNSGAVVSAGSGTQAAPAAELVPTVSLGALGSAQAVARALVLVPVGSAGAGVGGVPAGGSSAGASAGATGAAGGSVGAADAPTSTGGSAAKSVAAPASVPAATPATSAGPVESPFLSCEGEAATVATGPGRPPLAQATLGYSGSPAQAFLFDTDGGRTVVVTATADCRVLARSDVAG